MHLCIGSLRADVAAIPTILNTCKTYQELWDQIHSRFGLREKGYCGDSESKPCLSEGANASVHDHKGVKDDVLTDDNMPNSFDYSSVVQKIVSQLNTLQ